MMWVGEQRGSRVRGRPPLAEQLRQERGEVALPLLVIVDTVFEDHVVCDALLREQLGELPAPHEGPLVLEPAGDPKRCKQFVGALGVIEHSGDFFGKRVRRGDAAECANRGE